MPSTPAPLEARPGSLRADCEEVIAQRLADDAPFHAAWSDDDPRWHELLEALMFIEARRSERDNYYAFRLAAASAWRILTNVAPAFDFDGRGGEVFGDSGIGTGMAGYAIIVRELENLQDMLGALLADIAHIAAPVEDNNETVISEATR